MYVVEKKWNNSFLRSVRRSSHFEGWVEAGNRRKYETSIDDSDLYFFDGTLCFRKKRGEKEKSGNCRERSWGEKRRLAFLFLSRTQRAIEKKEDLT